MKAEVPVDLTLQTAVPTPVSPARRPQATVPPAAPGGGKRLQVAGVAAFGCNTHVRGSPVAADDIPEDLRDPFYIDQYEQEHIKPPVIKLLLSSELYCRVCSLILKGDQVAALQGHQSVIQALSRKGIYVMESDDTPVTEPDLSHAPIKMVSGLGGGGAAAMPRNFRPETTFSRRDVAGLELGGGCFPGLSPGAALSHLTAVNRVAFRGGDMGLPSPL